MCLAHLLISLYQTKKSYTFWTYIRLLKQYCTVSYYFLLIEIMFTLGMDLCCLNQTDLIWLLVKLYYSKKIQEIWSHR